jgi:hypothetical protein
MLTPVTCNLIIVSQNASTANSHIPDSKSGERDEGTCFERHIIDGECSDSYTQFNADGISVTIVKLCDYGFRNLVCCGECSYYVHRSIQKIYYPKVSQYVWCVSTRP